MSKSYDRNIERLRANQRSVSDQEQAITTSAAQARGQYEIDHATNIANKLTPFSTALQEWKDKNIKKQIEEGRQEREKARLENAKWMAEHGSKTQQRIIEIEKARKAGELAKDIEDVAAQDDLYQTLTRQMLKRGGVNAFPDADRLAKLSPWQQVGFVQESIKNKKAAMPEMIAHAMQNSTEEMSLGGITFTPKEISENGLAFPMKEHALQIITDKVYRNLGLDKYSEEMLDRAQVPQAVRNAKESILSKYRARYNIESSMNTQAKAFVAWEQSEKTGKDIQKLLLTLGNTVNSKNVLLLNSGAWALVESRIVKEGASDPLGIEYVDKLLDVPMPDSMCRELGVDYGTTFAKQWPGKVSSLKSKIKAAQVAAVTAEDKYLTAQGTNIKNNFRQEASQKWLDGKRVEEYKDMYTAIGQDPPEWLNKYETASKRDQRKDEEINIPNLMAGQNGFITNDQLDEFHPAAALKFRKDADRHEAALKKTHNVDNTIKAALNSAWTEAGIKHREKSVVWEYALANAQKDYEAKFNKLVALGYDADSAVELALRGTLGSVVDKENKPMPEFEGVISEIQRLGANSKYTEQGEKALDDLGNAKIRVSKIHEGKLEMLKNEEAISDEVVGGQYGQDRINEIIESIKIHGLWKGIRKADNALKYYEGLALGKRGLTTYALIDKQLKAAGHPGIFPERVDEEDETGQVDAAEEATQQTKYEGDLVSYNTVTTNLQEIENGKNGLPSSWNSPDNTPGWLTA